jgi:hypothetical protein
MDENQAEVGTTSYLATRVNYDSGFFVIYTNGLSQPYPILGLLPNTRLKLEILQRTIFILSYLLDRC